MYYFILLLHWSHVMRIILFVKIWLWHVICLSSLIFFWSYLSFAVYFPKYPQSILFFTFLTAINLIYCYHWKRMSQGLCLPALPCCANSKASVDRHRDPFSSPDSVSVPIMTGLWKCQFSRYPVIPTQTASVVDERRCPTGVLIILVGSHPL